MSETSRPALKLLALLLFLLPSVAPAQQARGAFGDELSGPRWGRDRAVDVLHYRLDVRLDPSGHEVRGTVSVRMVPLNDGLVRVDLDAGPMEIESVTLEPVEGGAGELPFEHDGEVLHVDLPRAYRAGEELTLHVRYAARPRAGLYFVGPDEAYPDKPRQVWSQGEAEDNHLWFPSIDYPNDRATSEEIYTVPAGWTAVGNGELVGVTEELQGTTSYHYRTSVPHVSYLTSVVAGRFEKYTDDFDGIPVEYYVPEGTGRETTLRSFGPTPDILRFFSDRTGVRYPYAKYAQSCAVDFIFGGMENVSATTQTAETLHDERAALETDSWGLVAHEAAHQWFGDLLTCANWSHAWLNEGFATYWENLWREHAQGRDEFLYQMYQDRTAYLEEDRKEYRRPIVVHRYTDPMDVFDSHLYPKGGWVLHMIRGLLGDDRFFRAMQHYTRTNRERVVTTPDLERAIADATGADLSWFFDQWLRHAGHPELRVTREWEDDAGLLTLHLEQTQEVTDLTPVFDLPLRIRVETAGGISVRAVRLSRVRQDVTMALDGAPLLVQVDPEFEVLMELEHERPIQESLRALAADPNPVNRIFAAQELAERAPRKDAVPGLRSALGADPFYGVRAEVAKALAQVGGDDARDALIAALADDDARVRTAVAGALGEFREDEAVARALREIPGSEPAYGTIAAAVLSLARIRAEEARAVALQALETPSYREQVRSAGLQALAELGDPSDAPRLREWTAYGKPPRSRTAAVDALVELDGEGRTREETVATLLGLLDDPYIWVRDAAIRGLGKLHVEEAIPALRRASNVEPDSRLRRQARRSLREIRAGSGTADDRTSLEAEVERLRQELRDQAERIRTLEQGGS